MPGSETKDFITQSTIGAWAKLPWIRGSLPESAQLRKQWACYHTGGSLWLGRGSLFKRAVSKLIQILSWGTGTVFESRHVEINRPVEI